MILEKTVMSKEKFINYIIAVICFIVLMNSIEWGKETAKAFISGVAVTGWVMMRYINRHIEK